MTHKMYTLLNSTSQLYFRFCLLVVGNRNLLAFRPFCAGYFVNCRYIVSFFSSKPNKIYYSSCFDLKWFRSRWSSIKPNQKLIFSILFSIHFLRCWKENLFTDQKLLSLVTISFILMTSMCNAGVTLWGEIRCWSL